MTNTNEVTAQPNAQAAVDFTDCPFCGQDFDISIDRQPCTQIQWQNCGAIGPTWLTVDIAEGAAKDAEIARLWNTRTHDVAAMSELLRVGIEMQLLRSRGLAVPVRLWDKHAAIVARAQAVQS